MAGRLYFLMFDQSTFYLNKIVKKSICFVTQEGRSVGKIFLVKNLKILVKNKTQNSLQKLIKMLKKYSGQGCGGSIF